MTPLEDVARPDKISGADINAICQEVGTVSTAIGSGVDNRAHLSVKWKVLWSLRILWKFKLESSFGNKVWYATLLRPKAGGSRTSSEYHMTIRPLIAFLKH